MSPRPLLHELPISQRPAPRWSHFPVSLLFCILFNLGCLMIHGSQLVFLLLLRFLPFKWTRKVYKEGIRYTKAAFTCLCILMCQLFAPTKLRITFEEEGMGKFTKEDLEFVAIRNSAGEFQYLNLPTKFVLISNHQVYADWWYAWCLTYFIGPRGVHRYVYITLKKSLKWIPIIGWGMQLYDFIFLARSWASDRVQLSTHLAALSQQAEEEDNPFCFLLYPEGTLVSENTRRISKKFADKKGISDLENTLLPRSTGLHYSLRSLVPHMPNLGLLDLTVIYPGIPPKGYGQDYYTLRSIFMHGVSPPTIHIHLRMFKVANEVPIGSLSPKRNQGVNGQSHEKTAEVDIPEAEKDVFDTWLRILWKEKDGYIANFLKKRASGQRMNGPANQEVEIPLALHRKREFLDAFCFFLPAAVGYMWGKKRE